MVTINRSKMLSNGQGSSARATGRLAVAHSTATPNAPAVNIATYENRTWSSAYVHYAVDDQGAYAIGQTGYQAWGAYGTANSLSPLQVELCEFTDRARALKAYANYVALLHDECVRLGIPLTLDDGSRTGIKTHRWVSNHFEGDHSDPVGYLNSIGISQAQFAADLKTGKTNATSGKATSATTKTATKPTAKPASTTKKPAPAVNVTYELHQLGGGWLGAVTNFNNTNGNGFAGNPGHKHDLLTVKVSHGSVRYQVHIVGGGWQGWVTKSNKNDTVNGCAGVPGKAIDGIQIEYLTPSGEPYEQAWYRTQRTDAKGWLGTVCDLGKSVSGYKDTYAGLVGHPVDRLQIKVGTDKPF